jgi:lysophospholipase L1-like esterase
MGTRTKNQAAAYVVAIIALIAFGAAFSEMRKARDRYWKLAELKAHDHLHRETREFIIRASMDGQANPIVVFGDSVTEMARFPEIVGDHSLVNAGIGGSAIADFEIIAPILMQGFEMPSMIAIALGTNDAGSPAIERDYRALLSRLKKATPKLLAIGVSGIRDADLINAQIKIAADSENVPFIAPSIPDGSMLPDGIHLNAKGYRAWMPAVVAAIAAPPS